VKTRGWREADRKNQEKREKKERKTRKKNKRKRKDLRLNYKGLKRTEEKLKEIFRKKKKKKKKKKRIKKILENRKTKHTYKKERKEKIPWLQSGRSVWSRKKKDFWERKTKNHWKWKKENRRSLREDFTISAKIWVNEKRELTEGIRLTLSLTLSNSHSIIWIAHQKNFLRVCSNHVYTVILKTWIFTSSNISAPSWQRSDFPF